MPISYAPVVSLTEKDREQLEALIRDGPSRSMSRSRVSAFTRHGSPRNEESPENHAIDEACGRVNTLPMEAAGIEPASRDISMRASTCVVG